jgi:hypothetical protein
MRPLQRFLHGTQEFDSWRKKSLEAVFQVLPFFVTGK